MVGTSDAGSASGRRVRVVFGDDRSESRRALRELLTAQTDIEVVGVANDGEVALRLLRTLRPDVAILDEDMSSLGGGAVARVLASELPDLQVVVLTAHENGGEPCTLR